MRKILLLTVATCAVVLIGCPKKKGDDADAASDAAAASDAEAAIDAAAAPAINAKNSADVARFAAETPMNEAAKTASMAVIRTSPKGGNTVATLKAGTDVTKVATYQEAFLITFADPKDAASTLMGWVGKEGFVAYVPPKDAGIKDATVDAAPAVVDAGSSGTLKCPLGYAPVIITAAPVCKRKCQKDADCKTTTAGSCQNANGQGGNVAKVCVND